MKLDKISHGNYCLFSNGTIRANVGFDILHDDGKRRDLVTIDVLLDRDDSLTVGQIQERALERAYKILALIKQLG